MRNGIHRFLCDNNKVPFTTSSNIWVELLPHLFESQFGTCVDVGNSGLDSKQIAITITENTVDSREVYHRGNPIKVVDIRLPKGGQRAGEEVRGCWHVYHGTPLLKDAESWPIRAKVSVQL